jgi:hypothetical protein
MALSCSIVLPHFQLELVEQFAQAGRGYTVMDFAADDEVWPLLALVLAELAGEADRCVEVAALDELIDGSQVFRVAAREAGASEAYDNFDGFDFRGQDRPLLQLQLHQLLG